MSRPVGSKHHQPGAVLHRDRGYWTDRETEQPPDEDAKMRNVVPAKGTLAGAGVGGVEEFVERGAALTCAVDVAQVSEAADRTAGQRSDQALRPLQLAKVGGRSRRWTDRWVQPVAAARQSAEELDPLGVPAADIRGDLFQDAERALAAAVIDRIGDIEPLAARVQAQDQAGIDQFRDVGDHPVVARLDRLVFPVPIDAAAKGGRGDAHAIDEFAQRSLGAGRGRVSSAR
jgi:hypothetical protein